MYMYLLNILFIICRISCIEIVYMLLLFCFVYKKVCNLF